MVLLADMVLHCIVLQELNCIRLQCILSRTPFKTYCILLNYIISSCLNRADFELDSNLINQKSYQ